MSDTVNILGSDWALIKRRNLTLIDRFRGELEALDCTPDKAQQIRGSIAALRAQNEFYEPSNPVPIVKDNPRYDQ
jgi:hypothetical protein